jgi:hypothetical protein
MMIGRMHAAAHSLCISHVGTLSAWWPGTQRCACPLSSRCKQTCLLTCAATAFLLAAPANHSSHPAPFSRTPPRRFAANACEGDAYWNSACQCPALNPIRAGYCYYSWRGFDDNAVCICGDDWWAIDNWPPIIYPRPPWWNNWWCNGRVCDTWRPICKRPPCAGTCNYWGCPGWPGVRPPIKPCRGRECPGWPGDKPITPCRGRDCVGPPSE